MTAGEPNDEGANRSSPIERLPAQFGTGPTSQGAIAAAVAFLSTAYPSAAVAVAAVGAFLPALGQKLNDIQNARTEELLAGAVTESALTPESVVRQLVERDDLSLLAAEALDAARRTRLPGKASTLGRCLGSILADDAQIDVESIWVRIISTVEPPHIRVLKFLLEQNATMGTGSTLWGAGAELTVTEMGARLGLDEAVLPLVQDLLGAGLVWTQDVVTSKTGGAPGAFDQVVQATKLGAQLFARLSQSDLTEMN